MKRKKLNFAGLLTVISILFGSCTPSAPEYISDYDVVYTNYKKDFDFNTVHTYFLPDSVVHIVEAGQTADHKFDQQILTTLQTNLNALGWTRLNANVPGTADLVVLPVASNQNYASCASYCWYCYWGWYPGWGYYPPILGPGWGWGYPADIVCTTYSTGTLIVNMTAPKLAANNTLPVAWVGILNGLLEGGDASINERLATNINQMFNQSPYLK